ncbi:hypothetical protein AcW1_002123 [Taiwanofungus camphoratus]|nr:hypothetical protein AcV5_010119 [Antrodia cinnamomea]KAI0944400.1 hypothetical protein AcW1_002123 [Antrodia cinnamomea]
MADAAFQGPLYQLTSEDIACLSGLSTQEMHEWSVATGVVVRQYLRNLDTFRNSTLPISRLPNELLVEIFSHVKDQVPYMGWIQLTHVCRHWRAAALATQAFWTSINIGAENGLELLRSCLRRSKNALVDVFTRKPVEDPVTVARILSQHAHRIWRMDVLESAKLPMTQFLSQLGFPMPRLEVLKLGMTSSPLKAQFAPDSCQFPSLRRLFLVNVAVPWHSSLFSSVARLEMYGLREGGVPSLSSFLDMLEGCAPRLECLTAGQSGPGLLDEITKYSMDQRVVSLPRLRWLELHDSSSNVAHLLAHITIPSSTSISLSCPVRANPGSEFTEPLSSIFPRDKSSLPIFSQADALSLIMEYDHIELKAAVVGHTRLLVEFYRHQQGIGIVAPSAFSDFAETFSASPLATVVVSGYHNYMTDGHWRDALSRLPSLERLVVGGSGHIHSLFQVLSGPSTWGMDPLICPCLKELSVDGVDFDPETVEAMLAFLDLRASHEKSLDSINLKVYTEEDLMKGPILVHLKSMVNTVHVTEFRDAIC